MVGVMTHGITADGIRHGTAPTGIVPIIGAGAGEAITVDGIHPGITTGIGHPMAGAVIMVDIMADIGVVTTAAIMADGDILITPIITGLTIVTNMDVRPLRVQATVMQATAGRPVYVRLHHNEVFRRLIAGAHRFEAVVVM